MKFIIKKYLDIAENIVYTIKENRTVENQCPLFIVRSLI